MGPLRRPFPAFSIFRYKTFGPLSLHVPGGGFFYIECVQRLYESSAWTVCRGRALDSCAEAHTLGVTKKRATSKSSSTPTRGHDFDPVHLHSPKPNELLAAAYLVLTVRSIHGSAGGENARYPRGSLWVEKRKWRGGIPSGAPSPCCGRTHRKKATRPRGYTFGRC